MRGLLVAVERVTCVDNTCCGFRRSGARTCNRCSRPTNTRPPAIGDTLAGPAGTPLGSQATGGDGDASTNAAASPDLETQHDLPRIALPADFVRRVRTLSSHTLLHIPKSCRFRMLTITVTCWLGMAVGSAAHTTAEEGRSKLLLASVPQGSAAADEVAKRLELWESGQLESLLQRIEQQTIVIHRNRSRGNKRGA